MRQPVPIDRFHGRVVKVRLEDAFTQIVEHQDFWGATEPAEGLFMEFGRDAGAGLETQQAHALRLNPSVRMNSRVRRYLP